jgi:hypothetical protein
MNRSTKLALGTLLVAGHAAYSISVPRHVTMTESELRAKLLPEFMQKDAVDEAAQDRYGQLVEAGRRLGFYDEQAPTRPTTSEIIRSVVKRDPEIDEIHRIAREGNLQRPRWRRGESFPADPPFLRLGEAFAYHARLEAQAGRPANALPLLKTSLWLVDQVGETCMHTQNLRYQASFRKLIATEIRNCLHRFSEEDLARLAAALPPTPRHNAVALRVTRRQIQNEILSFLANPAARARAMEQQPHLANFILKSDSFNGKHDYHAETTTYDAYLTVDNANDVLRTALRDTLQGWNGRYPGYESLCQKLESYIPPNEAAEHSTGSRFPYWVWYRYSIAKTRNVFGDRFLAVNVRRVFREIGWAPYADQTTREMLRTLIALRRYRLREGRPAESLSALVERGLLPRLPIDGFGTGTLQYSPKTQRLWSVGPNLTDEGGFTEQLNDEKAPDLVWKTS